MTLLVKLELTYLFLSLVKPEEETHLLKSFFHETLKGMVYYVIQ